MASATTTRRSRKAHDGPKPEDVIVAEIIELMEQSDLPPWRQEWTGHHGEHRNLLSGHTYRGANPILLELGSMLRGHTMPLWLGAAEAKGRGWWPRKGCKSVRILRPQLNRREEMDSDGKPATGPDGTPLVSAWVSFKPVAVFNVSDLVGHDDETAATLAAAISEALAGHRATPPADATAREERAMAALSRWTVTTQWGGARACYNPALDQIRMPHREAFASCQAMLATWAHEQAHSTGHSSRLDREISGTHGSQSYAREELVAELAAVLICYRLQIGCNMVNHAAYLKDWATVLRNGGPRVLFRALSDARKAADLIAPEEPAEEA